MTVELVDDSWIDSVGGLSRCCILRMPPLFWANAMPLAHTSDAARAPANTTERIRVSFPGRSALFCAPHVEPRRRCGDILHCSFRPDRLKSHSHRKPGVRKMKMSTRRWLLTLASL